MTDALELFRAARPNLPAVDPDIRQANNGRSVPTVGGSRDLHDLAMVPGSPAYRARIPKPPCWQCGEDHFAGRSYDHDWQPEPVSVHDEPVSAAAITRRPVMVAERADSAASRRVALYVGRGDTYVVAVESAPDWDTLLSFRVSAELVLPLVTLARALEVKVADKTGGDLLMLEQEYASEHAQNHDRGPAPARDPEPRRPGPAADRAEESEPGSAEAANGGLPGGGGERRRPARRAER
jgi:hypothetical protein